MAKHNIEQMKQAMALVTTVATVAVAGIAAVVKAFADKSGERAELQEKFNDMTSKKELTEQQIREKRSEPFGSWKNRDEINELEKQRSSFVDALASLYDKRK